MDDVATLRGFWVWVIIIQIIQIKITLCCEAEARGVQLFRLPVPLCGSDSHKRFPNSKCTAFCSWSKTRASAKKTSSLLTNIPPLQSVWSSQRDPAMWVCVSVCLYALLFCRCSLALPSRSQLRPPCCDWTHCYWSYQLACWKVSSPSPASPARGDRLPLATGSARLC